MGNLVVTRRQRQHQELSPVLAAPLLHGTRSQGHGDSLGTAALGSAFLAKPGQLQDIQVFERCLCSSGGNREKQDQLGGRGSYPSKKRGGIHQGFGNMKETTELREMQGMEWDSEAACM